MQYGVDLIIFLIGNIYIIGDFSSRVVLIIYVPRYPYTVCPY